MSNISKQIKQKYQDFTKTQLLDAEKRHEDEYIHGELMWQYKKEEILTSWKELLHWMHDRGYYKKPISSISAYIKNRLRVRGASEGSIDYVDNILEKEYKESKYDTYSRRQENSSLKPSIFESFEDMANQVRNKSDIEQFSDAELDEVYKVFYDKKKEIRKRLSDTDDDYIEVYKERKREIPRFANKETARDPPEEFWGQSAAHFAWKDFGRKCHVMGDYAEDIADLMYKYKPNSEVSQKVTDFLNGYYERVFNPLTTMIRVASMAMRGVMDMAIMPADAKNRQPLQDWLETGFDKEVNYGSHGAGVLHAIKTGQYIMELGKDKKSVVVLPLEREFTREQCTDKIPKLLQMSRDIVAMHECEQIIQVWSKETKFEQVVGDPEDFYKREMAKRGNK